MQTGTSLHTSGPKRSPIRQTGCSQEDTIRPGHPETCGRGVMNGRSERRPCGLLRDMSNTDLVLRKSFLSCCPLQAVCRLDCSFSRRSEKSRNSRTLMSLYTSKREVRLNQTGLLSQSLSGKSSFFSLWEHRDLKEPAQRGFPIRHNTR